jgi:hypothetical protein
MAQEEISMHDNEPEILPEWLREPGAEQTGKRGPESGKPSGQSLERSFKMPQERVGGQAGPSGPQLTTLTQLDKLLPHLGLRTYRARLDWQEAALSVKQVEYLKAIGIDPTGVNRGLGAKILDYFRHRRERGLASFKQLRALIGADVVNAESVDFETAKRILANRYGERRSSSSEGGYDGANAHGLHDGANSRREWGLSRPQDRSGTQSSLKRV